MDFLPFLYMFVAACVLVGVVTWMTSLLGKKRGRGKDNKSTDPQPPADPPTSTNTQTDPQPPPADESNAEDDD